MMLSVGISPYPTKINNKKYFGALGLASFEFFVSDKVSLSGSFFTSNNILIKNNSGVNIHSYGFMPSIHYYFVNEEKWRVFAQVSYGYGFEDQTRDIFRIVHLQYTISGLEHIIELEKSYT